MVIFEGLPLEPAFRLRAMHNHGGILPDRFDYHFGACAVV
jgi:hypothetical protein